MRTLSIVKISEALLRFLKRIVSNLHFHRIIFKLKNDAV